MAAASPRDREGVVILKAEEKHLERAFTLTRQCEPALRQSALVDLGRWIGPLWYTQVPDTLTKAWQRRQDAEVAAGRPVRGQELLDYATIDEVAGLINLFWDAFEARFGDRDWIQGRINEFRSLRNVLMHGADLTVDECERLCAIADDLAAQCKAEVRLRRTEAVFPSGKTQVVTTPGGRGLDPSQEALLKVVSRALDGMSGKLIGEREAIVEYVKTNLQRSSPDVLARIRAKFSTLPETDDLIGRLHAELPPGRPPQISGTSKAAEWLKWTTRFYAPYRRWLIRNNLNDPIVDAMASEYEDWLNRSYPDLLSNGDVLVVNVYKVVRERLDRRERVLWLVVDNLCSLWFGEFVRALEDAGIQIRDTRRMLSMLPSNTAVSRRAMLAGRLPVDAVKFRSEADACRQLWMEQGIPNIAFCTSITQVERALPEDFDLIILVDDVLDTLAHVPDRPGFYREEQMTAAMNMLAFKISSILRKMQSIGPSKLIVSTDHGAVWPSVDSQVITVPPSGTVDDDFQEHRRYCQVQNTTGINFVDWHVLNAHSHALPTTYVVPRGQRYVGARPKAYTHGGLSPEETVVTLLVGDVERGDGLELVLAQATSPLRLGRPGRLAILVRNPFDVPVENLIIALPDLGVRFDPVDVDPRSEAITTEQQVTLPLKLEVHDRDAYLNYTGEYHISGKMALLHGHLRVSIQLLYQSSLDDLEDMLNG